MVIKGPRRSPYINLSTLIWKKATQTARPPLSVLQRSYFFTFSFHGIFWLIPGLLKLQVETLRFEQERLLFLRENAKLEQEKLSKDVILADIEIEKARHELELLKRRRQV